MCASSLIRYIHKHTSLIHPLYIQLLDSCNDLPLSSLPSLARSFWDSPAIVSNLVNTSKGQGLNDKDEIELAELISSVTDAIEAENGKIQKGVYFLLRDRLHQADLYTTIAKRCTKYFVANDDYIAVDWAAIFAVAVNLGSQVAFSYLKTILGAWVTSRRIQHPSRKCIFCHSEEDSLQHL